MIPIFRRLLFGLLLMVTSEAIYALTATDDPSIHIIPIIESGTTQKFVCELYANNTDAVSNFRWFDPFSNKTIDDNYIANHGDQIRVKYSSKERELEFMKFTSKAANIVYGCEATVESQTLKAYIKYLYIKFQGTSFSAIDDVKFQLNDSSDKQQAVFGTKYKIKCDLELRYPNIGAEHKIEWTRMDLPPKSISNDTNHIIERDGLVINEVRESDKGDYQCAVSVHNKKRILRVLHLEVINAPKIVYSTSSGHSLYSDTKSIFIPDNSLPGEPTISAPLNNNEKFVKLETAETLELKWQIPSSGAEIDKYRLEFCDIHENPSEPDGFDKSLRKTCKFIELPTSEVSNSYTITDLAPDTFYRVTLQAHNNAGYGKSSKRVFRTHSLRSNTTSSTSSPISPTSATRNVDANSNPIASTDSSVSSTTNIHSDSPPNTDRPNHWTFFFDTYKWKLIFGIPLIATVVLFISCAVMKIQRHRSRNRWKSQENAKSLRNQMINHNQPSTLGPSTSFQVDSACTEDEEVYLSALNTYRELSSKNETRQSSRSNSPHHEYDYITFTRPPSTSDSDYITILPLNNSRPHSTTSSGYEMPTPTNSINLQNINDGSKVTVPDQWAPGYHRPFNGSKKSTPLFSTSLNTELEEARIHAQTDPYTAPGREVSSTWRSFFKNLFYFQ